MHPNTEKLNLKFCPKEDNNTATFESIWSQLHGTNNNPKIGMLMKDAKTGQVAEEYQKYIETKTYTPLDVAHFFNECFVKKDEE